MKFKTTLLLITISFTLLAGCKEKSNVNNYHDKFIQYGHICDSLTWTLKDTAKARMAYDSVNKYYNLIYPEK